MRDAKGRFCKAGKIYMTGFKAFGPGMICKGKQYAENTVFEEPEAVLCRKGIHFCATPSDVLQYYPLCDKKGQVQVAPVEALAECKTEDGIKFVTTGIKIGTRFTVKGFVEACKKATREKRLKNTVSKSPGADGSVNSGADGARCSGGKNSLCTCINGKCRGGMGSVLTIAKMENGKIVSFKSEMVDGGRIRENTWYQLENGEFAEVEE